MKIRGFESCKSVLSFSRYVMEKNDIGMVSGWNSILAKMTMKNIVKS